LEFYKETRKTALALKKSFLDCLFFVPKKISLKQTKIKFLALGFCLLIMFSFCSNIAFSMIGGGNDIAEIAGNTVPQADETCSLWNDPARCFILPIFKLAGFLLILSGTVFKWIINPENIQIVLNGSAAGGNPIYEVWQYVRDLLNMAFIMVLLFSAFCTIFQVEQYNYKKVLWKIVLMALLVNFSFPITRFIIDASNILMYSIINTDVISAFGTIAESNGAFRNLLLPRTFPNNTNLLVAAIMIFMLAITFLAVGILLLVRMIVLAILIIFSPIAFVGSILPGAASYSSDWWNNLFKYSFFGPIMILGIVITVKLMNGIGGNLKAKAIAGAEGGDPNLFGSIAYMALPLVLLWVVIGMAQKMGGAGAGAVMGAAQGAMKWSAKAPGRAAWLGIKKSADASGLTGGVKQAWNKKITQPLDRGKQKREAWVAGKLRDRSAAERNMKIRASEYEKNNESVVDLKEWASKGDASAAYTLANRGKIDQKTFTEAMANIKDEKTKESLMSKAEDTRMDVTIKFKHDQEVARGGTKTQLQIATEEYGNLNAEGWSKQKNLTEQFAPGPNNPLAAEIEAGAKAAFGTLDSAAKTEAFKRMNGGNAAAIAPQPQKRTAGFQP
jgi:hypothetical protein